MPEKDIPMPLNAKLQEAIKNAVSGLEFSTFEVGISCADAQKKQDARAKALEFISATLQKRHLADGFDLYILLEPEKGVAKAEPQGVYIEGRYNKFSRIIAQTFHYCFKCKGRGRGCDFCNGTGKLTKISVQELLEAAFIPAFEAQESRFHGCGREDVDVLMLGSGRPFVLELVAPKKRTVDLNAVGPKINLENVGLVAVSGLQYCRKERIAQLKTDEFSKIYSAKCACEVPVSEAEIKKLQGQKIGVAQRTPQRVEKRRADRERAKSAQITEAQKSGEKEFTLEILSSQGLYIKEFISGDNGRTVPSVSSLLGKKCVCIELDVLEIIIPGQ